jgi:1-acyl-sn-glycerol-3-phosphate acyltransferase
MQFRKWIGLAGAVGLLSLYSVMGGIILILPLSPVAQRRRQARMASFIARSFLKMIRVKVELNIPVGKPRSKGRLLVANHVSTLDVIAILAESPTLFTTSVEIEKTPVLGFWTRCAGTLYVERRHRDRLPEDIEKIRRVLEEGFDVVVFPEGTSTNGSELKRFKQGLFNSALAAGADVVPICIQYRSLGDEPITASNRDRLFYYGDHQIQDHLSQIFTNEIARIELKVLPAIAASGFESSIDLANHAREQIVKVYQPI